MWLCKNIKEEKGVKDGQVSQQLKKLYISLPDEKSRKRDSPCFSYEKF